MSNRLRDVPDQHPSTFLPISETRWWARVLRLGRRPHVLSQVKRGHSDRTTVVIAGLCYALQVMALWSWFGLYSGLPYETTLVYMSETRTWLAGFFYEGDPLRRFTSVFYHLAYLLGILSGSAGSFVPYQLVYAALWVGRGLLVFLIVRSLLQGRDVFAYVVGTLTLCHASDLALNWVGQMNQFGYIFWMLLSFYLLLRAIDGQSYPTALTALFGSMVACDLSLWSYEAPLMMIIAFPSMLLMFRVLNRWALLMGGAYLFVPAAYVWLTLWRYIDAARESLYQTSVLHNDLSLGRIALDAYFNVWASLAFWTWAESLAWQASMPLGFSVVAVCVIAFILGAILIYHRSGPSEVVPESRECFRILVIGFVLLVLSFPAYLVLDSARSLWRTQMLAGVGAAITMAALPTLIPLGRIPTLRLAALLACAAVVAGFGTVASAKTSQAHREVWERHRFAISQVLAVAPRVRSGTVIVLTNVPRNLFGHNMWFDVALRLAYPATRVAGIYLYDDGTPGPGTNLKVRDGGWHQTPVGFPTLLDKASLEDTVIIRFNRDGSPALEGKIPSVLITDFTQDAADLARVRSFYSPSDRVLPLPPSTFARRRYGPIPNLRTER